MKKINMNKNAVAVALSGLMVLSSAAYAKAETVDLIAKQNAAQEANTNGKGFGPQSPRDLDQKIGTNLRAFGKQPTSDNLNLCNIHFHKNAEHRGGEFTTFAGPGDGKGGNTGFVYDGKLTAAQLAPVSTQMCAGKGDPLKSGDTLEVHFVYSTAQVQPGPTLGACLSENSMNPGLRVEGQVIVLANDPSAMNFSTLAMVGEKNGYFQAVNIPSNMGTPIEYIGSTTGPSFNETASPLKVTWSVRPQVAVVDINSVGKWCESNVFNEDHSHGVRNLVVNPKLLSPMTE